MNNYFPSRDAFQHGRYSEIPEESDFGSPEFAKVETPGLQIWQSPISRSTTWHSPTNRQSVASLTSVKTLAELEKSRFWDYLLIVSTVLPCLFFVFLALAMIGLQGKSESTFGQFIMQVTQVAPTLWPIVFAAILGMMIRAWAHQKLENGTTVGVLEQLSCSQTVTGVLRGVWVTRTFSWYTLILILLWILSPLGGQASLRILYQQQHTNTTTGTVSYADIRVVNDSSILHLFGSVETLANFPLLRSIYGSVLTSPGAATQYADGSSKYFGKMVERLGGPDHAASSLTQDLWLNPRVPRLETMRDFDPVTPDKWLTVGNGDHLTNYSSLLGIPIRGIPALFDGNMTFMINSSYHNFHCSEWLTDNDEIADWMSVNYDRFEFWPSHPGYESWSDSLRVNMTNLDEGYMGFFVDTLKPTDENPQSNPQTEIVFGSLNDLNTFASVDQTSVDITTCRVNVTYVQVMMECVKLGSSTGHQSCRASQIRANPVPPVNANINAFQPTNMTTVIAQYWPRLVYMQRNNPRPSITQQFLDDPGVLLTGDPNIRQFAQLGLLSPELFSFRLSLVWNSFYMAVVDPVLMLGGDNGKSTSWTLVPVEARFDAPEPLQYALYPGWLAIYITATAVLVGATVATIILRINTKGPEILGYVSSLMRDSRFTEKGARAGSALSGDDRSRLLKSVRVKLMDVEGDRDIGRIAFTEIDGYNGTQKRRLREDRMYY